MASHAPATVEADSAKQALYRKLEFYPTPLWAARAGGELVNEIDPPSPLRGFGGQVRPIVDRWTCWEPACGEGHMAAALGDYFGLVRATDIHAHDPGLQHGPPLDFLSEAAEGFDPVDWIVTNPPFGLAAEFVAAGLRRARRGVAILARTSFLESASRFGMFFEGEKRLYAFAPFAERVPMTLGRWDPRASTATSYAWFVWMQPAAAADMSRATRRLVGLRPEVWPIAPGTRERLTRPDDARLWGAVGPAPLFDGGDLESVAGMLA